MADGKVLEFSGVTKVFGDVSAVSDLTTRVEPGVVTAVLGPNGAGKTTSLRILLGEIRPSSGTATIGGSTYAGLSKPARTVGAVLETPSFRPRRTATRQLTSVAKANGIPLGRVREVLDLVGLSDVADMRIASYSLGMRQRLSIAQALLGDPGVLVFDEPVNGMDPEGIRWMRLLMRRLADEGRTVLMSSHLLSEVQQIADRILIISNGRLVFAGELEDLADVDPIVIVDSPDRPALVTALRENGYEFEVLRSGVNVRDARAKELGEVAATAGIALSVLHQRGASLEDVFLDLVNGRPTRQTAALPQDASARGEADAGTSDAADAASGEGTTAEEAPEDRSSAQSADAGAPEGAGTEAPDVAAGEDGAHAAGTGAAIVGGVAVAGAAVGAAGEAGLADSDEGAETSSDEVQEASDESDEGAGSRGNVETEEEAELNASSDGSDAEHQGTDDDRTGTDGDPADAPAETHEALDAGDSDDAELSSDQEERHDSGETDPETRQTMGAGDAEPEIGAEPQDGAGAADGSTGHDTEGELRDDADGTSEAEQTDTGQNLESEHASALDDARNAEERDDSGEQQAGDTTTDDEAHTDRAPDVSDPDDADTSPDGDAAVSRAAAGDAPASSLPGSASLAGLLSGDEDATRAIPTFPILDAPEREDALGEAAETDGVEASAWARGPSFAERFGAAAHEADASRHDPEDLRDPQYMALGETAPISKDEVAALVAADTVPGTDPSRGAGSGDSDRPDDADADETAHDGQPARALAGETPSEGGTPTEPDTSTQEISFDEFTAAFGTDREDREDDVER